MEKRKIIIVLLIFLNQFLAFGQEVKELKLIKEEKIETKVNENSNQYRNLHDHNGKFITKYNYLHSEKGYEIEFLINGTSFKLERFLFATVNINAHRLYTFGKSPFPSDCGTKQCPVHGVKIYDLDGKLINSDSTIFTSFSKLVSDNGNLFITGKVNNSDTLLLKKFNLNGNILWENNFQLQNKFEPRLRLELSSDGALGLSESSVITMTPINMFYIIDGESGDLILEKKLGHRSRIVLFNKADIIYQHFIHIAHQSLEHGTGKNLDLMSSRYITSDKSGRYFGALMRINSANEIPIVIYKKEGDEYIKFREANLSEYGFKSDSKNRLLIPHGNWEIKSNGSVEFVSSNKKLIFN